jgi:TPR repeat protein
MGVCYDDGKGVKQNHKKAVEWYTKAAEQGDAQSQYNLAVSYLEGEGVKKDEQKAIMLLRQAAEQGDTDAKALLQELGVEM